MLNYHCKSASAMFFFKSLPFQMTKDKYRTCQKNKRTAPLFWFYIGVCLLTYLTMTTTHIKYTDNIQLFKYHFPSCHIKVFWGKTYNDIDICELETFSLHLLTNKTKDSLKDWTKNEKMLVEISVYVVCHVIYFNIIDLNLH